MPGLVAFSGSVALYFRDGLFHLIEGQNFDIVLQRITALTRVYNPQLVQPQVFQVEICSLLVLAELARVVFPH